METIKKIKQILHQHFFIVEHEDWYDAETIAEELAKVFSSNAVLTDSLPLDNDKAWNTHDVIEKLCEATDILLHKKDYDGHGHEEILICLQRGRELLQQIKR